MFLQVWSWRHAIQKSSIPSTTKLVLFNLSVYMNDAGEGCYPSTQKQAEDTGLSERSICTHLDLAEQHGFISVKKHGYGGQKWARNEYFAQYPKGTEPDAKALNLTTKGTEPDDKKALKEVQSNSSEELSSNNSPLLPPYVPPAEKSALAKKATVLPDDFLTVDDEDFISHLSPQATQFMELAIKKGMSSHDAEQQIKRFYNYWTSLGNVQKARKSDWLKTWRNWIASPYNGQGSGSNGAGRQQRGMSNVLNQTMDLLNRRRNS